MNAAEKKYVPCILILFRAQNAYGKALKRICNHVAQPVCFFHVTDALIGRKQTYYGTTWMWSISKRVGKGSEERFLTSSLCWFQKTLSLSILVVSSMVQLRE